MRAHSYLDAVRSFPLTTVTGLTQGLPILMLSPHPDDETLGAGGLIASAATAGIPVSVVILTDGSGSHPRSPSYPRDRLVDLRRQEVANAIEILGIGLDKLHHLNLVDTHVPTSGPTFDDVVASITRLVRESGARSLFVTWELDPHCDHVAAAIIARTICRANPQLTLWAYPIWGWHLDPHTEVRPSPPRGRRLDISDQWSIKRSAITAHRSQMTNMIDDDPDGFTFTEQTLAPFLGRYEYFIEVAS